MDFRFYEQGRENLAVAARLMTSWGWKWWLDAGSSLGAIRDHDLIPHDTDIDIALFGVSQEKQANLAYALQDRGFEIIESKHFGKMYEWGAIRGGVKLDFFNYYDDGGEILWHRAGDLTDRWFEFSRELFDELTPIEFIGVPCFIPISRISFWMSGMAIGIL